MLSLSFQTRREGLRCDVSFFLALPVVMLRPKLLKLTSDTGETKMVFWKEGDDLRLDRAVLFMLDVFNGVWRAADCRYDLGAAIGAKTSMHDLSRCTSHARDQVVQAATYRVCSADLLHGFVECLPEFREIGQLKPEDWKQDASLFSSSVGAIVSAFLVDMRDRHDGNMGLISNNRLANIDFGWVKRCPLLDTGDFAVPAWA